MAPRRGMVWLLLLPYVALLWVPWYARATPTLWGFPFFYWYMFMWVVLTAALTGAVYWLRRKRVARHGRARPRASQ